MKNPIPYLVEPEDEKFYSTTEKAYYIGLVTHLTGAFLFFYFNIRELAIFNAAVSVPIFLAALVFNRLGKHNLAFGYAFFELYLHQVVAVYYLGWASGFQFWLIFLLGIGFFNPNWKRAFHVLHFIVFVFSFVILFSFFQEGMYLFSETFLRNLYLSNSIMVVSALTILINTYVTDAHKAELIIKENNKQLSEKNHEIQTQNDQIFQSINYAERIQKAVLPKQQILDRNFAQHFILFLPKDIVSGDFYWFAEIKNKTIVVCADSTGHGVPGGFMSMLGVSQLNELVVHQQLTNPAAILEGMRNNIKESLQQTGDFEEQKDGMDMSIIVYDPNEMTIDFAGANLGIIHISNNQLTELKPTKNPVAVYFKEIPFELTQISVTKGDAIYMFTDGYLDQFGGKYGRKLMRRNFKALILEAQKLPINEQYSFFAHHFHAWKGTFAHIDDVTLMGFQI